MFTNQDLISGVRMTQLNDPDATTWPDSTLIIALNQALLLLALIKPEATSKVTSFPLIIGSRQFIPTDGIRLLRVIRNKSATGVIGRAVRLVSRESMDSMSPAWHKVKGPIIKEYMFDDRAPRHFYVYPSLTNASAGGLAKNLYRADLAVQGKWIDSTGALVDADGIVFGTSDFISVVPGAKYTITGDFSATSDTFLRGYYYNVDKVYIDSTPLLDRGKVSLTITIPPNTYFIRLLMNNGAVTERHRAFYAGTTVQPYDNGINADELEIEYSAYPKIVTEANVSELLPVSPVYAQPLQELMLYKLTSGDASSRSSGLDHLRTAIDLLKAKDDSADKSSRARRKST